MNRTVIAIALAVATSTASAWQSGGYTVTNPYNPTDTYNVTPQAGGGYRMQNPYNPTDTYNIRPTFPQQQPTGTGNWRDYSSPQRFGYGR